MIRNMGYRVSRVCQALFRCEYTHNDPMLFLSPRFMDEEAQAPRDSFVRQES